MGPGPMCLDSPPRWCSKTARKVKVQRYCVKNPSKPTPAKTPNQTFFLSLALDVSAGELKGPSVERTPTAPVEDMTLKAKLAGLFELVLPD